MMNGGRTAMKIALFALALGTLHGTAQVLADADTSSWNHVNSTSEVRAAGSRGYEPVTDELSRGEFMISQSGEQEGEATAMGEAPPETEGNPVVPSDEGGAKEAGAGGEEGGPREAAGVVPRRPLRFEFLAKGGRQVEGLSLDELQIDEACALLTAKDDVEVLEKLAKCVKLAVIGDYFVSSVPEVLASSDMVRFVIPVAINRFKTVHLEASMKDGSAIPVNCSPQVSLSSENGFATVFPMIEDVSEDRRKLRYKLELPDYLTVSSSSFRILTSGSSGCRLVEADLGLEFGKSLGIGTLDENGASFSAQFVPSDPALLIVLTRGSAATADGRLGREWRRQAGAIIETAFEIARQNFSQVIVAGYTETSDYAVLLKVPKTQFRKHLKRIQDGNGLGFTIDKVGEGLDASLQDDLEKQISELTSQGVSVLTVIYGRQPPEGSLCDFGFLANNQFMERLGQSLIIDVLPTKAYNTALKSVRENENASDAVIVTPESENFSSIDCVKYAGLIENRELSRRSSAFALPLLKADGDLSDDYRELSRKWIGGLLETAP
jgi:hypothetical protein